MNELSFPLQGYSGDEEVQNMVSPADVVETSSSGTGSSRKSAGEYISDFLGGFFNNMNARALNNQAIAQYNAEVAANQQAKRNQNMIMLLAMIVVFVFVVLALRNK